MATQSALLYNDSSTVAMFAQWASTVSSWIAGAGWNQTKDTGQVMWTGMSLSAVAVAGSNATYTYSGLTGLALQNGRALTITGMTNSANNGVFVISSFTGTTSGTFTVVNSAAVIESGSTGVVTKFSSIPGSNAFPYYEIWQPGDALTPYYMKIEYGNYGSTNNPSMRLSLSLTTNGAGTFYGGTSYGFNTYVGPLYCASYQYTALGTSVPYTCYFSGDSGRLCLAMWSNGGNNAPQMFAIERSVNASGAWTGNHVTLMTSGVNSNNNTSYTAAGQQTLHFTYGGVPTITNNNTFGSGTGGFSAKIPQYGGTGNVFVNSQTSLDTVNPYIGYFDYPLTTVGVMSPYGIYNNQIITVTLYGASRTYLCCTTGTYAWCGPRVSQCVLCMRYD